MAKKRNRQRKNVIFISREGKREEIFIKYLQELFDPNENIVELKYPQETGGNSNVILERAIKTYYEKTIAWFDEDNALDKEHRKQLEKCWNTKIPKETPDRDLQSFNIHKRKPILIVSTPMSVEGIIIRLCCKSIPSLKQPILSNENLEGNKRKIKAAVKGFIHGDDIDYYRKYLDKNTILKKAKSIKELRILLSIFNVKV